MRIAYDTSELEKVCTHTRAMRMKYPEPIAKGLQRRIKQMESAATIRDLLDGLGKWHPLTGRGRLVYGANLSANWRVTVQFEEHDDGSADATVTSIEDYH